MAKPRAARSQSAKPASPADDDAPEFTGTNNPTDGDNEEVPGAGREEAGTEGDEAGTGAEYRDPQGDEVSKPSTKPTSKAAQPKVQIRKTPAVDSAPGGSAAAAREAAPSDFILAKIPDAYGSATIYGRGGKESVHAGGETVEMTRAQAERIGAAEVKKKGRTEPAAATEEE